MSDERRNVAEELRDLIDDDLSRDDPRSNVPLDDVERAIGLYGGFYDGGTTADCVEQLADLIDPTCRDIGDGYHVFVCSRCGCELDVDDREGEPTMWDGGAPAMPRYCPNCGARVVRAND